jgi:hypothetical protein
MKNLILLAIGATLLSTSAFASKARLEALGEDFNGSQYIDDNRNMFLNAAEIHNHHDFLTFEFGNTEAVFDREAEPKATGGYFGKHGDAVWGLYLGQDSNTASSLRSRPFIAFVDLGLPVYNDFVTVNEQINNNNTVDLFYGRDGAVKWGVRLSHSQSSNEQNTTGFGDTSQKATLLGLGAIAGDWEYYANIGLQNEAEVKDFDGTLFLGVLNGEDYRVKGGLGVQAGAIKTLANNDKFFAEVRKIDIDQTAVDDVTVPGPITVNIKNTMSITRANFGYAGQNKFNDMATGFYRLEYWQETTENQAYIEDYNVSQMYVRATVGLEAQATSWLVLRGSVRTNIHSLEDVEDKPNGEDGERTIDFLDVNLGASITFGDFVIDGLISNDSNGDGAIDPTNDAEFGAEDNNGILRTDSLMSRVSMTYRF